MKFPRNNNNFTLSSEMRNFNSRVDFASREAWVSCRHSLSLRLCMRWLLLCFLCSASAMSGSRAGGSMGSPQYKDGTSMAALELNNASGILWQPQFLLV